IVTLLNISVSGLAGRFGDTTARSVVKPSLLLVSALQKAVPAGPDLEPMIRSMCATSLPSPTSDSPRKKSAAIERTPVLESEYDAGSLDRRVQIWPCVSRCEWTGRPGANGVYIRARDRGNPLLEPPAAPGRLPRNLVAALRAERGGARRAALQPAEP